jgi:hypothetical protein
VESVDETNTVDVIADMRRQRTVRSRLETKQERYPIGALELHAFGEDAVVIEASLAASFGRAQGDRRLMRRLTAPAIGTSGTLGPNHHRTSLAVMW